MIKYIFPGGALDDIGTFDRGDGTGRLRGARHGGLADALRSHVPPMAANG